MKRHLPKNLFMKSVKKNYVAPSVKLYVVECEESLAAFSAETSIGGPDGTGAPFIEDWEDEGETGNHFTL